MIELAEYLVTMWPRHGATHALFVEAPDAFTAREYALRICPDQHVVSIRRTTEAVAPVVS